MVENETPLAHIPEEARTVLREAAERVSIARAVGDFDEDSRSTLCRRRARDMAAEHKRLASSTKVAADLAACNADVAAVESGASFPHTASVPALIFVANTCNALAAVAALEGRDQAALDLAVGALQTVRTYRALSRARSLDSTIYAISARAAASAGKIAAMQGMSPGGLLEAFDVNVTRPFSPLMNSSDLSAPRAFAVVALLRAALAAPPTDASSAYLQRIAMEIERIRNAIRPSQDGAAMRFDADLGAVLDEVRLREHEQLPAGFQWE
jgi:hypothetical protein